MIRAVFQNSLSILVVKSNSWQIFFLVFVESRHWQQYILATNWCKSWPLVRALYDEWGLPQALLSLKASLVCNSALILAGPHHYRTENESCAQVVPQNLDFWFDSTVIGKNILTHAEINTSLNIWTVFTHFSLSDNFNPFFALYRPSTCGIFYWLDTI